MSKFREIFAIRRSFKDEGKALFRHLENDAKWSGGLMMGLILVCFLLGGSYTWMFPDSAVGCNMAADPVACVIAQAPEAAQVAGTPIAVRLPTPRPTR